MKVTCVSHDKSHEYNIGIDWHDFTSLFPIVSTSGLYNELQLKWCHLRYT